MTKIQILTGTFYSSLFSAPLHKIEVRIKIYTGILNINIFPDARANEWMHGHKIRFCNFFNILYLISLKQTS